MLDLWFALLTSGSPIDVIVAVWLVVGPVLLIALTVAQIVQWRREDRKTALREARYAALRVENARHMSPWVGIDLDCVADGTKAVNQRNFDEKGLPRGFRTFN